MGGYGSGRSGGRPTTENGLTLSLSKLMRDRLFRPGCAWGGSIVWTNTATGEQVGSIGYEAHLGQEFGPRPTALHDHPMGWRTPRVRLLDPARDDASALWRPTVVVRLPADGKASGETLPA